MRIHGNNGGDRHLDYYEEEYGQDEYLDYSDADEEEEEKLDYEDRKPRKEEQKLFSLREKIKAQIRQDLAKQDPNMVASAKESNRLPVKDRFGSFFGPSSTVIAPRVMDEIRSIEETRAYIKRPSSSSSKNGMSSFKQKDIDHEHREQRPKVVKEGKRKAQQLKESRDFFSSLFAEGSNTQTSTTEQSARGNSAPGLDRVAQTEVKNKASTDHPKSMSLNGHPSNVLSNGRPSNVLSNGRPGNVPSNRRHGSAASNSRFMNPSSNGSSTNTANSRLASKMSNGRTAGVPLDGRPANRPPDGRPASRPSNARHESTPSNSKPAKLSLNSRPMSVSSNGRPASSTVSGHVPKNSSDAHRLHQDKLVSSNAVSRNKERPLSTERRPVHGGTLNGSRHTTTNQSSSHRPLVKGTAASKLPVKSMHDPGLRNQTSTSRPHPSEQRRPVQMADRERAVPKHSGSLLKSQPSRLMNPHGNHDSSVHKRPPLKRRLNDDDEDDAIGMIREMFRYNPNKYAGSDEDDSDMEVGFDTIQMEERRSEKIGKMEDDEELRIQEEEARERERKKRRKMMRG